MKRSFWSTIRGKLVSRTLLVVMLPLIGVGGVAVAALIQLSDSADESVAEARDVLGNDVVGARAWGIADQVSREIAIFVDERLSDAVGWADDREIVTAAASAGRQAEREGLTDLTIEELEAQFADDRQLGSAVVVDLRNNLVDSPDFKEVFFTNEYGHNVAVSNQTSDFVQSDEDWWQQAWDHGVFIDEPEFDGSAGVFAVDISIRIDQTNGVPVGVMKASLDIALVQSIADRFVAGDGEYEVTIIERLGRFVARTENDHNPNGIMNDAVTADISRNQRLIDGFQGNMETHPDGYSIDDEAIAGYSHIAEHLGEMRPDTEMAGFEEAFDWVVIVEQPTEVGFAALSALEQLSTDLSDTSRLMTLLLAAVAALALLIAVVSSFVFSRRITIPIQTLRDAAVYAADVALPAVVAQIDELGPDDEIPSLDQVQITTGDEVEDLAHSFNTVQQTAADLAAQQARLRRQNVATTFVSMGRRNQNLLSKQLEHINAMEQNESDSETLRRLFQLDHLATRMRRNAESLLVLAGEETPRRFRAPVSIRQLVQAAGGEIEEFDRIDIGKIDEAAIEGGVASDVAHLLAELLENASRFSPPTTEIQIHGRRRVDGGYVLSLIDEGLGMEGDDLATANERLSNPVEFDRAPSAYLGLFVVGHLARRHGLAVRLSESTFGGITAMVEIPAELLVASPAPSCTEPVAAGGYREELLDEEPGYAPELVLESAYESEAVHRAVEGGFPPVSDLPAEPLAEWLPMPDPWLEATPEPLPDPWLEATPEPLADPWADAPPKSLPDPWLEATPEPLPDPWLELPGAVESEPVSDLWSEVERQPTAAKAEADSPVEAPVEATTEATTAPEPMPGMPLTTTMPIAIPMADPEPIGATDEIVAATPLPPWGRDPEMDRLSEVPPAPPPLPEEIQNLASYASSHSLELQAPTPPPPPLPPPPPPPSAGSSSAADPVGELTASGFRRRRRGHEGAPAKASPAQSDEAPSEPPHRDADTVQASLARFRAGVTQGRAAVGDGDDLSGADDRDER